MLWIAPNNFAYQKSRGGWNYHWKKIFSTIFHLYSKIHIKQSLEGRKLEQVVCWCKFTSFLKFGVNRIFWGALIRQLRKNNDFFAVFGEKKEGPFTVVDVNVEKIDLIVWSGKGLAYAETWVIARSRLKMFASPWAWENWSLIPALWHLPNNFAYRNSRGGRKQHWKMTFFQLFPKILKETH